MRQLPPENSVPEKLPVFTRPPHNVGCDKNPIFKWGNPSPKAQAKFPRKSAYTGSGLSTSLDETALRHSLVWVPHCTTKESRIESSSGRRAPIAPIFQPIVGFFFRKKTPEIG